MDEELQELYGNTSTNSFQYYRYIHVYMYRFIAAINGFFQYSSFQFRFHPTNLRRSNATSGGCRWIRDRQLFDFPPERDVYLDELKVPIPIGVPSLKDISRYITPCMWLI